MKFRSIFAGASLAAVAWSAPGLAQDDGQETCYVTGDEPASEALLCFPHPPIVVAGSRGNSPTTSDYTGSLAQLSAETIAVRQVRDIADILRDVPGVAVSSTAGQTQLRLRGTEANHVIVLVDGIEVSDPFAGEFDIGTLQAEIGSRLEVLRGPQSALYGSDAIGGVVNSAMP